MKVKPDGLVLHPMHKIGCILVLLLAGFFIANSQEKKNPGTGGMVTGNLLDERKKSVSDATVELIPFKDGAQKKSTLTDKNGSFTIEQIPFGYYKLRFTSIGFKPLTIDSLYFREERFDFNLNDITIGSSADQLEQVIVYAEKPLIQSKEGNITFNAGESALSAGSNASDLLKNVPLVATDPNGKITVRGKEPRILIDDKPVELNAQQLQDFLESMPGSMIERIEVMTNPPPQYANEQGGVINIVTRKGKVGMGGRLGIYAGSRGEGGVNGNFNYRKKGLAINFHAGTGYNQWEGNGYSRRQNLYPDSTNNFNTDNVYRNKNLRPNARLSVDYDINERNIINAVIQYNQNDFRNKSVTRYTNINRFGEIYKLSDRAISSEGENINPSFSLTYTHKGKKPGETLKIFTGGNYSYNRNDRHFFQQFLTPDGKTPINDSTQNQFNDSWNHGYYVRVHYDKLLDNKKTSFSTGGSYNFTNSHVLLYSEYLKKPEGEFVQSELLSNDFRFRQRIANIRFSMRQIIEEGMSVTAGLTAENTNIHFDLYHIKDEVDNSYVTWLPFGNFNKTWKDVLNLTLAYRRTIRRPGIYELNPSIDYGDPYNLRFGNPTLLPSTAHNFDLVLGRTKEKYYLNFGLGYNLVQNVYAQIRSLLPEGKTQITFQNIDDRMEYEVSTWSGYTFSKKLRLNFSASYTYNAYSDFDRKVYKYRNGGSLTSNLNANYAPKDVWNFNGSLTLNRFANPQGYVRWNTSMNIGIQRKFFAKRFIVTINAIDPIVQQKNHTYTYAPNFLHESFSTTNTRNYRLTLTYNFVQNAKKSVKDQQQKDKLKTIMAPKA